MPLSSRRSTSSTSVSFPERRPRTTGLHRATGSRRRASRGSRRTRPARCGSRSTVSWARCRIAVKRSAQRDLASFRGTRSQRPSPSLTRSLTIHAPRLDRPQRHPCLRRIRFAGTYRLIYRWERMIAQTCRPAVPAVEGKSVTPLLRPTVALAALLIGHQTLADEAKSGTRLQGR